MVSGSFERLNLDRLVHAFAADADPMPGRLSGRLMLAGDPRYPRDLFGNATVNLSETDLINSDPLGFLYDLMRVGGQRDAHSGVGSVQLRLENQNLDITRLYLSNRGVEVRGVGTIRNVFALPNSPLHAVLVGTSRPLRDLRLPLFAEMDSILTALQSSATTVEVSGTVRNPKTRAMTFDQIGQSLQLMLLGDVQAEKRQK
jgi:hypothetical protein